MTLAIVHTRALHGIDAPPVDAEVHLAGGLPSLSIVGLPETAVKESKDRVRAALQNAGFDYPRRRITVNLTPADLPKEGGRYDLPIALGILAASGQLPSPVLAGHEFIGELTLGGALRPVLGALPAAIGAGRAGRALTVPLANADEAALADRAPVYPAGHLLDVCARLRGTAECRPHAAPAPAADATLPDLADVRGQQRARRALEIAAAGGHNLLFVGPPGTGKSMLAARLPGILPPMSASEALEAAAVASVGARGFEPANWGRRPFRTPHHTASGVALVGGGSHPRPGEVSLAHHGVLFLDELAEFDRKVLEVLREPLENGRITISRAARSADFPARFQLVAAMNPCPCGQLGDPASVCRCTPEAVRRYRGRLSGPFLDRIDLHVEVPRLPATRLRGPDPAAEGSATVRGRVCAARERALQRHGRANGAVPGPEMERDAGATPAALAQLDAAIEGLGLSARAWHRSLRLARTIADLAGEERVEAPHVAEAVALRVLDRAHGATDVHAAL
ncbi:MAG: YifB family Mg chelatase-like AAA ATPase [Halofilum sp. (in: g-proteobacteria)]|nr:YifB family Mg chelatase-like AAA ATPase [Halofilum sp. (in: g-proteobacteria)]